MCNPYYYGSDYRWNRGSFQQPPVNIKETEEEYIINLYAPSLKKEAISITTKGDVLSIKYDGDQETTERFTRKEFHTNSISRSFDLKGKVKVDAIDASYIEGILKIVLPKTDLARRPSQNVEIR
jgi:HSP20 family protein